MALAATLSREHASQDTSEQTLSMGFTVIRTFPNI